MWSACTGVAYPRLRRTVAEQLRMHMGRRGSRPRKGQRSSQCQQQRDGNLQPHKQPISAFLQRLPLIGRTEHWSGFKFWPEQLYTKSSFGDTTNGGMTAVWAKF